MSHVPGQAVPREKTLHIAVGDQALQITARACVHHRRSGDDEDLPVLFPDALELAG